MERKERNYKRAAIVDRARAEGKSIEQFLADRAAQFETQEALADDLGYSRERIVDLYRSYGFELSKRLHARDLVDAAVERRELAAA
jgi:hypothetical protein